MEQTATRGRFSKRYIAHTRCCSEYLAFRSYQAMAVWSSGASIMTKVWFYPRE